jgi:pyruvate,water dikinase
MIVRLGHAEDAALFGGKAAALARGLAAGLPIPDGIAIAADHEIDRDQLMRWAMPLHAPLAVRSSAIGEDSAQHSFAGIHLTRLGVAPCDLEAAVADVRRSVHSAQALAYRARRGIAGTPRTGVVIQPLVAVEISAVVFTRSPVAGRDEVVIEATLGLGESVVAGTIIPDRYVLDSAGRVLEQTAGDKDVALVVRDDRIVEIEPDPAARRTLCLSRAQLAEITALIASVDRIWPGPHDLEVGFAAGKLHLFQRRPQRHGEL